MSETKLKICAMCGEEFNGDVKFCVFCADYLRQSYEQMAHEAEYSAEMREDAFSE
ncbi:MAG: hypothetical protein AB7C97_05635 [Oscillospiraceae bacterium]